MSKEKMQYCFNCGESLGVYHRFHGDEPECCGKKECNKELRYILELEREELKQRAEDDDYSYYSV